jgi:hypothetical protein
MRRRLGLFRVRIANTAHLSGLPVELPVDGRSFIHL